MPAEILDSTVRLMWDPDGEAIVLLQIGDPMWSLIKDNGQQVVEAATLVRAAGIKALARGNESHEFTFELVRATPGPVDAFRQRLRNITTLPKGSADMLISFDVDQETEEHFRLKDSAIRGWPGFQEDQLAIERISILGGQLVVDEGGPYEEGSVWGEPVEE